MRLPVKKRILKKTMHHNSRVCNMHIKLIKKSFLICSGYRRTTVSLTQASILASKGLPVH